MPPKVDNGEELTFVVSTNPHTSSAADRKKVRSAAALKSWPDRRKRTFEQFRDHSRNQPTSQVPKEEPGPSRGGEKTKQKQAVPIQVSNAAGLQQAESSSSADAIEIIHASLPSSDDFTQPCSRESTPELPCQCWKCQPERSRALMQTLTRQVRHEERQVRQRTADGGFRRPADVALITPPSSPSPSPPVSEMADPFNCYPVPYRPWFDGILHHMLTVFAPRGWPALKITHAQGLQWEWFMTQHALAEPALFYVRLLFASGDLIRVNVLKREVSYWLQAQAIQSINEALKDPKRATSDQLILAVGRIALHEGMYGDRHASNTVHRPAQQRMIQMRGGMKALEFPDLVKRLMRWADTVMAKQGGTERFLEDDETNVNFTMSQSVEGLEQWVPAQGQELRKKIRISDLVNE